MSVRTLGQLRADQERLLGALRARVEPEEPARTAEGLPPVSEFGRVTGFVYYHPTIGPHLLVQPYIYEGVPAVPVPADMPERTVRPTPNFTVFGYALDEYVEIVTVRGAQMAVKMR